MRRYLVMSAKRGARIAQIRLIHALRRGDPDLTDGQGSDPIAELTQRLRHPARWRFTHPVQAMRRAIRPNA